MDYFKKERDLITEVVTSKGGTVNCVPYGTAGDMIAACVLPPYTITEERTGKVHTGQQKFDINMETGILNICRILEDNGFYQHDAIMRVKEELSAAETLKMLEAKAKNRDLEMKKRIIAEQYVNAADETLDKLKLQALEVDKMQQENKQLMEDLKHADIAPERKKGGRPKKTVEA